MSGLDNFLNYHIPIKRWLNHDVLEFKSKEAVLPMGAHKAS